MCLFQFWFPQGIYLGVLGNKSNLSTFKKIEIISSIFSEPQCYENRDQCQGNKKCKKHKHMEIKQYVSK